MEILNQEQGLELLRNLRELTNSQGWKMYKAHLAKHLTKRERAKSTALRVGNSHLSSLIQGEIDGLNFATGELDRVIDALNLSEGQSAKLAE